jgi:peptidoglycan hydrolase-like protein with peptidoglycan-binding domain
MKHNRTLTIGSVGPDVMELQIELNEAAAMSSSDLPPLEVDGEFGSKTYERVLEFQRKEGLTPDGVVGPQTGQTLEIYHVMANPQPAGGIPAPPSFPFIPGSGVKLVFTQVQE